MFRGILAGKAHRIRLDLGDGEPRHSGELPHMGCEHRPPLVVRDPPRAPETVCIKHDAALRVVKQKAHPALCVPVPHAHTDGKGSGFFCKFLRALFLKYDMPVPGRQGEHRGVSHHGIERGGKKIGDGEHRRARARTHRRLAEKSEHFRRALRSKTRGADEVRAPAHYDASAETALVALVRPLGQTELQ